MKGRKKIPDELKVLRGTDQPCRMEKTATTTSALTTLPKTGLKGTAKKVFALVVEKTDKLTPLRRRKLTP